VIALIDYKAGNLTSVKKALATIGADVFVPDRPDDLADAAGIIVPGVGHFGATRASISRGSRRSSGASAKGGRCSGSASGCSGCSKAAMKRRTCRGSA